MKLIGGIASHVGNVREVNQDRAFFGGHLAAVADGMGGHQGGEIAAQVAVSGFDGLDGPIECDRLLGLVSEANSAVFDKAIDPDLRGMGTTLVVLALQPETDQVTIANVGDSRAYHFFDGTLRQITVDHSLVQDLVTAGKITEEEAQIHPQRNIVTRALGISPTVEADSFMLPARVGDRFLLCSDGLINEVEESRIAEMLQEENPAYVANSLVQAAINEAGRDNVTVAVIDIVEGEDEPVDEDQTDRIEPEEDPTQPFDDPDLAAEAAVTQPLDIETISEDIQSPEMVDEFEAAGVGEELLDQPVEADENTVPQVVETIAQEPEFGELNQTEVTSDFPSVIEPAKKRSKLGFVAASLAVVGILAAAFFAVNWYGTNSWHLTNENGTVAIYRGQPGGFLWLDSELERSTEVDVDELDEASRQRVDDELTVGSLAEAEEAVENLTTVPVEEPEEPEASEPPPETTVAPPPAAEETPPAGGGAEAPDLNPAEPGGAAEEPTS